MRLVSLVGLLILIQSCRSNDDWIIAVPGRGLYINGDSILIYRTSINDLERELGIKRDTASFPDIRISDGFIKETGEQFSESKFVTNLTYKSIDFEFSGNKEDSMKLEWIRIKNANDIKVRVNDKLVLGNNMVLDKVKINGNAFYDIQFRDNDNVVSVSLENIENYFQVILFKLDHGQLPDYDDKTRTIHLGELNRQFLTALDKKEFEKNDRQFDHIRTDDKIEQQILESAKDLRLCFKQMKG